MKMNGFDEKKLKHQEAKGKINLVYIKTKTSFRQLLIFYLVKKIVF